LGGLEVEGLREATRGCDATMEVVADAALEELMIVCLYERGCGTMGPAVLRVYVFYTSWTSCASHWVGLRSC
jgi:hypothetical protein